MVSPTLFMLNYYYCVFAFGFRTLTVDAFFSVCIACKMVAFSLVAPAAAQTGATSQRATLSSSLKRPAAAGPAGAASAALQKVVPQEKALGTPVNGGIAMPVGKKASSSPLPPVKGLSKPSLKRSSNTMQVAPTAQAASKKVGSKAKQAARKHRKQLNLIYSNLQTQNLLENNNTK